MSRSKALKTVNDIIHQRMGRLEIELQNLQSCLEGLHALNENLVDEDELAQEQDEGIVCGERAAPIALTVEGAAKMSDDLAQEAALAKSYFEGGGPHALGAPKQVPLLGDNWAQAPKPEPAPAATAPQAPAPTTTAPRPRKKGKKGKKVTLVSAIEAIFLEEVEEGVELRADEIDALVAQRGCASKRASILALLSQYTTGKKPFRRGKIEKVSRGVYRWASGAEAAAGAQKEAVSL